MKITSHGTGKLWPPIWSTHTRNGFRSTRLRTMAIEEPIFQLIICLGILILTLLHAWVRRVASVGLPLCYILSLAMIHWLGGLIHVLPLPWHSGPDPYTQVGFREAFWATVAFATGSMVLAPFILKFVLHGETSPIARNPDAHQARLPLTYLLIGTVSF